MLTKNVHLPILPSRDLLLLISATSQQQHIQLSASLMPEERQQIRINDRQFLNSIHYQMITEEIAARKCLARVGSTELVQRTVDIGGSTDWQNENQ